MKRMMRGRRWIYSSALALTAIIVLSGGVFAGGWCRADPIVQINGEEVQIWVAIPDDMQHTVNGPIQVLVSKPWGTDAHVTFLDEGFNGHGETVRFFTSGPPNSDGSMDIQIMVSVPVDTSQLPSGTWSFPVMVEVITDNGTTVSAGNNWWTSTQVTVGG